MENKLIIKEWALEDRPREKMLQKGVQSLSNAELLAILLSTGNKNETALNLAQRILNSTNNNLNNLGKYSASDLTKRFLGVGIAKAVTIMAAMELGRRRKSEGIDIRKHIRCSKDIYNLFYSQLIDIPHEEFWVVLLNPSNKIIDKIKVGQGGVSFTAIDIKLIMKIAIEHLASRIAICHNHPSNSVNPSSHDNELTKKINDACLLLDIKMVDHIIICENGYYSYADNHLL